MHHTTSSITAQVQLLVNKIINEFSCAHHETSHQNEYIEMLDPCIEIQPATCCLTIPNIDFHVLQHFLKNAPWGLLMKNCVSMRPREYKSPK